MRKRIFGLATAAMILLTVFVFAGCEGNKVHDIPDGDYISIDGTPFNCILRPEGNNYDWYWRIKSNTARFYSSGQPDLKLKIVVDNGEKYFEDHSTGERTRVIYDDCTKTLTIVTGTNVYHL